MEQHAIPRQITSFEFKLIGFMTLRQFLYLVVAFPIAYIVYALFPIPILNIVLAFIVAMIGVVVAFLPFQDRSLDIWAKNLWKRLQNPTQYHYQKHNDPLYFLKDLYFLADPHHMLAHIESKEKLAQYLAMTKQRPRANYEKKQIGALLQAPTNTLQTSTAPIVPSDTAHAPSPAMQAAMNVSAAPSMPHSPVAAAPKPVLPPAPVVPVQTGPQTPLHPIAQTTPTPASPLPAEKPVLMQTEVVVPKQTIQTQPVTTPAVPAAVVIPPAAPVLPAPVVVPPATVTPPSSIPMPKVQPQAPAAPIQAKVIPPQGQTGNQPFFSGVVRTSKRIPVPGILVYIKDDKGSPLRLMKSNPHGVFATFNPLQPGDYTFEIKDPTGTYFFDTMKVPVKESNSIPVEFMSKEIL